MSDVLKECIREIIVELRLDTEMLDLYKERLKKLHRANPNTPLDALHEWMHNAEIAIADSSGNLWLDDKKMTWEEYQAMRRYVVPRFAGLLRQYRRSKDPTSSALSALQYYIANYYNSQVASGVMKRKLYRTKQQQDLLRPESNVDVSSDV